MRSGRADRWCGAALVVLPVGPDGFIFGPAHDGAARVLHRCHTPYMVNEPDVFAWEMAPTVRGMRFENEVERRIRQALRASQRPLYYVTLGLALLAYTVPLFLFEPALREALLENDLGRVGGTLGVLSGISTLVISPIFGYVALARREGNALLELGRAYRARVERWEENRVCLSLATAEGNCKLVVEAARGRGREGDQWWVYAMPQETRLVAVQVPGGGDQMRVGHLEGPF